MVMNDVEERQRQTMHWGGDLLLEFIIPSLDGGPVTIFEALYIGIVSKHVAGHLV